MHHHPASSALHRIPSINLHRRRVRSTEHRAPSRPGHVRRRALLPTHPPCAELGHPSTQHPRASPGQRAVTWAFLRRAACFLSAFICCSYLSVSHHQTRSERLKHTRAACSLCLFCVSRSLSWLRRVAVVRGRSCFPSFRTELWETS